MVKASSNRLSSVLSGGADTIVAQATGTAPAALAMVRVSGPKTQSMAARVCPGSDFSHPWEAQLVSFYAGDGREIERGICIPYVAPRSFTGEDMLEVIVHGSSWIVEEVIAESVRCGARRAVPGEFTQRAVANGKMDLVQAEGINELIRAETAWQARLAREQVRGGLSGRLSSLKEKLVALRAQIEASLDFVDQGAALSDEELGRGIADCIGAVQRLLDSFTFGERVREGARVVIVGPPNSGKSTLFNTLLARERAIVTPHPGTTRDLLEATLDIGGIPVVLVDTAGVRTAEEAAEAEGVRRAEAAALSADLVLLLRSVDNREEEVEVPGLDEGRVLRVTSKSDLAPAETNIGDALFASCITVGGLAGLRSAIEQAVLKPEVFCEGAVAINRRHEEALIRARESLENSRTGPREVVAEQVRDASRALEEVLGGIDNEAVLDAVFSSFCLGK